MRTGRPPPAARGWRGAPRATATRSSALSVPATCGWGSASAELGAPAPAAHLPERARDAVSGCPARAVIASAGMDRVVRIGHSPDPDDAFMFYALTAGKVRIPGVRIEHVLEDIESLNRRSREAELEVTAVSFATYLLIAERYRMMDPGASMGKGYGPILVAREAIPRGDLESRVTAIAGKHTTSALLLRLYVGDPHLIEV